MTFPSIERTCGYYPLGFEMAVELQTDGMTLFKSDVKSPFGHQYLVGDKRCVVIVVHRNQMQVSSLS